MPHRRDPRLNTPLHLTLSCHVSVPLWCMLSMSGRVLCPLQLEFQMQRLLIPQGFSLTLKNLALGRARQTSGQGLPFFVGELGCN